MSMEDYEKKSKKFAILGDLLGKDTSLSGLLGLNKKTKRAPRHQDMSMFRRRKDYSPREEYAIVNKKVPSISNLTKMITMDDLKLTSVEPDLRSLRNLRLAKKGQFVQAKCKIGKNKPTKVT
tara:strand:+ start:535 stop:900 length:366 start_codon:yes stop_codon:yes gene_type:complete